MLICTFILRNNGEFHRNTLYTSKSANLTMAFKFKCIYSFCISYVI